MKSHLIGIILGIILGIPTITFGSSFTYSLIQGKTPEEAFVTIGNQLDILFGRVSAVESKQATLDERVGHLEATYITRPTTTTAVHPIELFSFTIDAQTKEICQQVMLQQIPKTDSLIGTVKKLCERVEVNKYESKGEFDKDVRFLKEKWKLWFGIQSRYNN